MSVSSKKQNRASSLGDLIDDPPRPISRNRSADYHKHRSATDTGIATLPRNKSCNINVVGGSPYYELYLSGLYNNNISSHSTFSRKKLFLRKKGSLKSLKSSLRKLLGNITAKQEEDQDHRVATSQELLCNGDMNPSDRYSPKKSESMNGTRTSSYEFFNNHDDHIESSRYPLKNLPVINGKQPGLAGLVNHGNTCFINSVLQCLSNTELFAHYFIMDIYKEALHLNQKTKSKRFGTQGELTEQLASIVKSIWACDYDPAQTMEFKTICSKYASQYKGNTQHDAQEFLMWLLDKVHEDLNLAPKKTYKNSKGVKKKVDEVLAAEQLSNYMRCNNSFVHDVFQAQFRSSLRCSSCNEESSTFDPFVCVSLPIPSCRTVRLPVNIVWCLVPSHVVHRCTLTHIEVQQKGLISEVREALAENFNLDPNLLVLCTLSPTNFMSWYLDYEPVDILISNKSELWAVHLPIPQPNTPSVEPANLELMINSPHCSPVPRRFPTSRDLSQLSSSGHHNDHSSQYNSNSKSVESVNNAQTDDASNNQPSNDHAYINQSIVIVVLLSFEDCESINYPFSMKVDRDISMIDLQNLVLSYTIESFDPVRDTLISATTGPQDMLFSICLSDQTTLDFDYDSEIPLMCQAVDDIIMYGSDIELPHLNITSWWSHDLFLRFTSRLKRLEIARNGAEGEDELDFSHSRDSVSLLECFSLYTRLEELSCENSWQCNKCKGPQRGTEKQLSLWTLPDVLVIHLKRFKQTTVSRTKLHALVTYPITDLDMSPFLADKNLPRAQEAAQKVPYLSPWQRMKPYKYDGNDLKYDLIAVCNHIGQMSGGHYTAFCKNPLTGVWYEFDDKIVRPLQEENVVSPNAYILFYQRQSLQTLLQSHEATEHWIYRLLATKGFDFSGLDIPSTLSSNKSSNSRTSSKTSSGDRPLNISPSMDSLSTPQTTDDTKVLNGISIEHSAPLCEPESTNLDEETIL